MYTLHSELDSSGGGGSSEKFKHGAIIREIAAFFAITASILSVISIWSHLKNYRKPSLQRYVVRIIIMVPIYAVSSWISLASTTASFYVDGIRDIYEAFVIYCFFNLLINYLGGERALLILLHGRSPTPHLFPVNIFVKDMDIGDPYMFLFLKRGILQYIYIKPILAILTMILKYAETYGEGHIEIKNGYIWVSLIYNGLHYPFLCILELFMIVSENDSAESISVSIQDFLITIEMFFASMAHWYAFSYEDYYDIYGRSGRMPMKYAFKDCIGYRDVIEDTLQTIRGSRFNYRTFEPAEGMAHIGPSRTARIMAGLRFTDGGANKYWLPPNSRTALLSEQYRIVDDDDIDNSLNFEDPNPNDDIEHLYDHSRKLGRHGDYNFPVIYQIDYSENNKKSTKNKIKKLTMSKRKHKGKNKVQEIFFGDEEGGGQIKEQVSNILPPGCIDLVKEVSDGNGIRFERYINENETISNINSYQSQPSIMQSYSSITSRDPFIQVPTKDPLGATSYLGTLEQNIWNDKDIWN
ncbi:6834_t:CDS:2 [Diversispora eburnea]|uniref:6834_t:CDS:1 n=1 Tax=Diversispora eburnea TaxID=1213867 RepID=A0A9N9A8X9_9GLOM|nr:6834_t:CDS:2 [Diversispora eburnea]